MGLSQQTVDMFRSLKGPLKVENSISLYKHDKIMSSVFGKLLKDVICGRPERFKPLWETSVYHVKLWCLCHCVNSLQDVLQNMFQPLVKL